MYIKRIMFVAILLSISSCVKPCELNVSLDVQTHRQKLIKQIRSKYKKLSKIGEKIHKQQELMDSFMDIFVKLKKKICDKRLDVAKEQNIKVNEKEVLDEIDNEWVEFDNRFFSKIKCDKNTGQIITTELAHGDIHVALLKFQGVRECYEFGFCIELLYQYQEVLNELIQLRQQLEELK